MGWRQKSVRLYFFYCITKALVTAIEFAGKGAGRFGENGKIGEKNKFVAAKGLANGETKGYTAQVTVKGYGGEIEIVVGVDNDGVITGINVGGANFSETAGLGAKTKEPAFTEQFKGLSAPLTLKGNVDSVSGASVSSGAIVNGVNAVLDYVAGLEK